MAKKISISFKETKKDMELYNILMAMEDKSYLIKEMIRKVLAENDVEQPKVQIQNNEVLEVDITDF